MNLNMLIENLKFVKSPRLISRIFLNYFSLTVLRKKVLNGVFIALNYDCQCNCGHCSSAKLIKPGKEYMGIETIKSLIDQAYECGAIRVIFTGGEPLLREDIYELVKYSAKKSLFVSLSTNGYLLNKKTVLMLKHSGLDLAMISLDNLSDRHDSSRKVKNLYKRVIKAITLCKKNGVKVIICSIATKQNIIDGSLESLIKKIKSLNAIPLINLAAPVGKWFSKDVALSENERKIVDKLTKKYNIRRSTDSTYLKRGCGAGSECLYISAYGDVLPCGFIHLSFGNIYEQKLSDIWRKIRTTEYFDKTSDYCLSTEDERFINNVIKPMAKFNNSPVDIKEHPYYKT